MNWASLVNIPVSLISRSTDLVAQVFHLKLKNLIDILVLLYIKYSTGYK